jgi:hypothetical protein
LTGIEVRQRKQKPERGKTVAGEAEDIFQAEGGTGLMLKTHSRPGRNWLDAEERFQAEEGTGLMMKRYSRLRKELA